IDAGHPAAVCLGQRSRRSAEATPDVENIRVSVEMHLRRQFQCRFPAAYMELVDCRKVWRCQFIEVSANAPQVLRDRIGQFEVFAVMACYAVGHRPLPLLIGCVACGAVEKGCDALRLLRAPASGHVAAPPRSVMNSRRFMGGGPHVGGRTIPRRCLKKLRCIAAKLNIEWQRWVIASDGDAPNAHRSGERVAFHDNQYRVFPGLVAHSVNATRALSVISRMCGILLRPGSSRTSP